jgi:hypothetical protein
MEDVLRKRIAKFFGKDNAGNATPEVASNSIVIFGLS